LGFFQRLHLFMAFSNFDSFGDLLFNRGIFSMRKRLKKTGSDGLMIYFTKEEIEMHGLVEGDIIDLDDMIIQEKVKKRKKS